jgi:hypothetical protein
VLPHEELYPALTCNEFEISYLNCRLVSVEHTKSTYKCDPLHIRICFISQFYACCWILVRIVRRIDIYSYFILHLLAIIHEETSILYISSCAILTYLSFSS